MASFPIVSAPSPIQAVAQWRAAVDEATNATDELVVSHKLNARDQNRQEDRMRALEDLRDLLSDLILALPAENKTDAALQIEVIHSAIGPGMDDKASRRVWWAAESARAVLLAGGVDLSALTTWRPVAELPPKVLPADLGREPPR